MNNLQKHRPQDVRQRISQALRNRTLSDSTKQKISATMKKRWAELQSDNDQNNTEISDIVL